MQKIVSDWLLLRSPRKGQIEISQLAMWILLVVFILLMLAFLIAVNKDTTGTVSNLCAKTGGLFGCS